MDQSVLSRYERGELRLYGSLLASIAKILRTSADQLLGLEEIKGDRVFADRRLALRFQQIESLPKRKRQALLTTLDEFLKGAGASS
jgi:transcriptional regulator with XRE-family HTH domain